MVKEMVQEMIDKFFKNLEEVRREETYRRVEKTFNDLCAEGDMEKFVGHDGEIRYRMTEKGQAQFNKEKEEGWIERQVCDNGEAVWRVTKKGKAHYKKEEKAQCKKEKAQYKKAKEKQ